MQRRSLSSIRLTSKASAVWKDRSIFSSRRAFSRASPKYDGPTLLDQQRKGRFGGTVWTVVKYGSVLFVLGIYGLICVDLGMRKGIEVPPWRYADKAKMKRAVEALRQSLQKLPNAPSDEELNTMISVDEGDLQEHSFSDWSTTNSHVKPVAVIYPRCTEDVVAIAKVCSKYRVPMVPYGAGSSVEGSFSAPHSGFTIDFSLMDKIIEFNEDDMDVVVQPGVNWVNLNKTIENAGLFLPLDPSPTALIGGMIATNCSGTNAMRYGTMKDWVINLTVVLADGTVVKTRRRPRKSSAGFDLTRLFVGSEGTLGFVTEATLKLAVLPKETGVATCSFGSVKEAAAAAVRMMTEGIIGLAALEIMDEAQMQIINKNGGTLSKDGKTRRLWTEAPTLFMKFSGTKKTITDDVTRVVQIVERFKGSTLEVATDALEKDAIWAARKEALWAMLAQRDAGTEIWSTDVAVPLSRLAEIIDISKKESSELGLFNSVLGHVGDGNFHQSVMYHPSDEKETAKVAKCVSDMMDRALEMEGTVSGEHAIGIGKKKSLEKEVGQETIDLMRRVKLSMDPYWLMNPGKVFNHKRFED
ncbi:hypothetical protein H2198_001387 [Neophaeococcomyces mojaviensis]|uniref:Uncharacterized protein n=1 Tax=Neophaeococcomyces mojaviensis TaxID=3383035 RepID=A0ACC3AHV3_9EURO|nr:hypothetical protein H2198_001387 [Knufia sp. JES_112]